MNEIQVAALTARPQPGWSQLRRSEPAAGNPLDAALDERTIYPGQNSSSAPATDHRDAYAGEGSGRRTIRYFEEDFRFRDSIAMLRQGK